MTFIERIAMHGAGHQDSDTPPSDRIRVWHFDHHRDDAQPGTYREAFPAAKHGAWGFQWLDGTYGLTFMAVPREHLPYFIENMQKALAYAADEGLLQVDAAEQSHTPEGGDHT